MLAHAQIEKGRILHLKDIAVYPRGAKHFELGIKEAARLRSELVKDAQQWGFNGIRISGIRLGGANPGRSLDFSRTWKK